MRRLMLQNLVTLDGYFEGPKREIDWHNVDGEFNEYAIKTLDETGLLLFGRVTYELMAGYWPTTEARTDDAQVAQRMNAIPKIVFSRTLRDVHWENTRLVRENAPKEVALLKSQPGKDIAIFGSSDLAVSLMDQNLIDEYRIFVNPVILGAGKPLFSGIRNRKPLKLLRTRTFKSGNVLLSYAPAHD